MWRRPLIGVIFVALIALIGGSFFSYMNRIREIKDINFELTQDNERWKRAFEKKQEEIIQAREREEISRHEFLTLQRQNQELEEFLQETRDFLGQIINSLTEEQRTSLAAIWRDLIAEENRPRLDSVLSHKDAVLPEPSLSEMRIALRKLQIAILTAVDRKLISFGGTMPESSVLALNLQSGDLCRVFVASALSTSAADELVQKINALEAVYKEGIFIAAVAKNFPSLRSLPRGRRNSVLIALRNVDAKHVAFSQEIAASLLIYIRGHDVLGPMLRRNEPYSSCLWEGEIGSGPNGAKLTVDNH